MINKDYILTIREILQDAYEYFALGDLSTYSVREIEACIKLTYEEDFCIQDVIHVLDFYIETEHPDMPPIPVTRLMNRRLVERAKQEESNLIRKLSIQKT